MNDLDPRVEYERRLLAAQEAEARLARHDVRLANLRLAVFGTALVLAGFAYAGRASAAWLLVPVVGFITLIVLHDRSGRALRRARRAIAHHKRGLDRLLDRWAGRGDAGADFRDPEHPYADDLDLFGRGSLFERLSLARTRSGRRRLAEWLRAGAGPEEVVERQGAVVELRPRLDFREDLALLGEDVPGGLDLEGLERWGSEPRKVDGTAVRWFVRLVSLPLVVTLVAELFVSIPNFWAYVVVLSLPVVTIDRLFRRRVRDILEGVDAHADELSTLSALLGRLEREGFDSPRLSRLRGSIEVGGRPASRRIARLRKLVELLESDRNLFFGPIAAVILWRTRLAFALEDWRADSGPGIADWLDAFAEFEALASLAAYAFENPADTFAEVAAEGPPRFESRAIGHPLLPASRCVRNDVTLGDGLQLLVVSGSNMSGKSTLLRAVGVNAVLALAGAPVRAERLVLSRLAIGATLRIQDSLQEGRSRFYAELLRLKQIVDLTRTGQPVLFLLDEILAGTNSHDRRMGAEGLVRGLIARGAIGLVTTHDLALAEIADALAPLAANVHFEDHLEGGVLHFDYQMRPGVVRRSNALELMRAVGLEV